MNILNFNLDDLCSVKDQDFHEIFDDFFIVRNINISELSNKIPLEDIYNNYSIHKIEIKKNMNYSDFLDKLLNKFNNYFYDGNRENYYHDKHQKKAYEWVNNYTPKTGALLKDFMKYDFGGKIGKEFLDNEEFKKDIKSEERHLIKDYLYKSNIENVLELQKGEKYILITKNKKIVIRSESEILGNLHGDIGEFILFFLVESILKFPLLFSKINHSKSSGEDKIKGSDGIHLKVEDGKIKFLFLESKFMKNFSECINKAIKSQKEFLENGGEGDINNEIHILQSNTDTINKLFSTYFNNDFRDYINPYYISEKDQNSLPFNLITGLIYECESYQSLMNGSKSIDDHINKNTIRKIETVLKSYKDIEGIMNNKHITIFLLPLISNEDLIKHFLDKTKS